MRLPPGTGIVGRSVDNAQPIIANDVQHFEDWSDSTDKQTGFVTRDLLVVPMQVKDKIIGVIEIINKKDGSPFTSDDQELLATFASQAAIAIDNATLFDDVQTANEKLIQAYDATIEGWARALELRDGDTEGHSSRVAAQAVQLAHLVGMKESEIVDLRRGALLHDIGKMGIPDTILLKNTDLTDKEWQIMRMHPILGKNMLRSIQFLKNAVEVAYCHHEKWDGTGYPQGLKGEEIPLAARIFSVIDGWDALRSDRPYRKAVSDEEAWKYIEDNIGKAYDPMVVEKFKILMKGQPRGNQVDPE
jgi:putative nucleotidyltransferase with HDIG domain